MHRATDLVAFRGQLEAFVELHCNVGAQQHLDFDSAFRRELDHGSVEVRSKCHRALVDLAQTGERHDLESAGVGEDRHRPVHEFVQPAERGDAFGARPQHQMVGVAEHDLGAGRAHVVGHKPFYGRLRADGHECRGLHFAVRGHKFAPSGGAIGIKEVEGEWLGHLFVMAGPVAQVGFTRLVSH